MQKILVAYTTNAGTTEEVAAVIGEELSKDGVQVDVRRIEEIVDLESYTAVVVGGPMIMGWHRAAMKFVKKHQQALSQVPVAYFLTAMSLTQTGETSIGAIPLCIDPMLAKAQKNANRVGLKERYATVTNYLRPVLRSAPQVQPVSIALFGGKLEFYRLKLLQMLFVMLIIQAEPGDRRNWTVIREWAAGLRPQLLKSPPAENAGAAAP
jgi:menaquinone-dependent protoporphyrinogen IX oxidase